jgi:hypothetical protein
MLGADFLYFETGELIQTQVKNRICLYLTERVTAVRQSRFTADQDAELLDLRPVEIEGKQFDFSFFAICRMPDDPDELIRLE